MNSLFEGAGIGLVIVTIALLLSLFYLTLLLLAKNNLFFTYVEEGRAKAVMEYGEFHKMVMVYKDHYFDQLGFVRHVSEEGKIAKIANGRVDEKSILDDKHYKIELEKPKSFLPKGIKWIGNPFVYSVHSYTFRWDSLRQEVLESGAIIQKTIHHDEKIDYIIVQDDVYVTVVKEAETKQMVPLDILAVLTIRVVNPYKALFRTQEWLEQTTNLITPAIRSFVGNKEYEDLTTEMKEGGQTQKAAEQGFLTESRMDEEIQEDYGVRIKKVGFIRIDPSGARALKYVAAASKKYEAQKKAESIEVLADAEEGRIRKVYQAVQDFGPTGTSIRGAEAIEKSSQTGKSTIIPFPVEILNFVKQVIGR